MNRIDEIAATIRPIDTHILRKAQERLDNLTKPLGSLGRLEEIARQVAGISGKDEPELKNKVIFVLAADHGVASEGVSAFPQEVTAQMVYNFLRGGAGINVLARHAGARVVTADVGVAVDLDKENGLTVKKVRRGTRNMAAGPAMRGDEAVQSVENGIDIFEAEFKKGMDIAGTGDMGIGNTTAASAITAAITGKSAADVTGRGTGIDDAGLKRKIAVIEKALAVNRPDPRAPLDVLSKVGGFEIGGLVGIILAAAGRKVPVLVDGFISGSAALLAYRIAPEAKEYMIASHCSVERGHRVILDYIGLKPVLDLDLRLGEGTGAALAMTIVEAAVKIYTRMATFKSAGVSGKVSL